MFLILTLGAISIILALILTPLIRDSIGKFGFLDHPDGDLRWADAPLLDTEITAAIRDYRADAVITFDDDGLYWHLDHIGVQERTYTAIQSLGADAPPLYYVTMPRGVMPAAREDVDR